MTPRRKFRVEIEQDVCVCSWDAGAHVTAEDAEQALAAEVAALAGRRMPLLARLGGIASMDRDARRVFGSASPDSGITALALLATSPVQRVVANFFLTINPPAIPARVFTDERAARRWLLSATAQRSSRSGERRRRGVA